MSNGFEKALNRIKQNKSVIESGGFNCIPFEFDRFSNYIPGIMQEVMYLVTANSGIGKSQITKTMFVRTPIKFIEEHPDSDIKLKIFYFALEESEEEFYNFLISARLKEQFNLDISPIDLLSFKLPVSNEIIYKIEQTRNYFNFYSKYLEVIDYISNPTGLFKHVREYARNNGKFFLNGKEVDPTKEVFNEYKANNPNEYVIVITDHIGLLQPEGELNQHQSLTKWSAEYCRKQLSKRYKYIIVNVQQQSAESEKKQFTNRGDNIIQKVEPSLDGLGENKLTVRDHHVVLGLFAPDRHEIETYLGYNVQVMKDNFRSLNILKNRIGVPNKKLPLYFDGATNLFKELPLPENMTNEVYEKIINKMF
jgi:hypothetical protein